MSEKILKIIEKRNLWFLLSLIVILTGLGVMTQRALKDEPLLNYGIDFVGGSTFLLRFDQLNQAVSETNNSDQAHHNFIEKIRTTLESEGLEKARIQISDEHEVQIKTPLLSQGQSDELLNQISARLGNTEVLEIDFIGPSIGAELRHTSIWIIVIVSAALLLYISWRFELAFGLAALLALVHDALITISFAALTQMEINTAFVAAMLTVLGYSINDTIVVFDRIRENIKHPQYQHLPIATIANISLTHTMRRTINTSATTLVVISCLMIWGGITIKPFVTVLFIGILAGTYSSIFIASPVLALFSKKDTQEISE